jgi:oligoendopeptidase F
MRHLTLINQQITWDLTELFAGITDPKVYQAIEEAKSLADAFEKTYRGKITSLTADGLLQCLRDLEAFEAKISDISLFSSLIFAADMTQPQAQTLNDRADKLSANIGKQLAFYSLELGALIKSNPQIINEKTLSNYRHSLERVHRRVEHQLSEVEEQLIIEKDQFGVNAWSELQSKWLNTRLFQVEVLGEKKTLPHPDRATRESANRAI